MIFLTIGTHEPFDRLVRAVDDWAGQTGRGTEVFGQITGRSGHAPEHFEWVDTMTPADYRARIEAADLIVSHAGMGSILTAFDAGKPILVLPRRGALGETRNDHQYDTAMRLGGRPGLHVAEDEAALGPLLDRLGGLQGKHNGHGETGGHGGHRGHGGPEALPPYAGDDLIGAIRGLISGAANKNDRNPERQDGRRPVRVGLLWHSVTSDNLGVGALTVAQVAIAEAAAARVGVPVAFTVLGWDDPRPPYFTPPNLTMHGLRMKHFVHPGRDGLLAAARATDLVLDIGAGDSFADIYGPSRILKMLAAQRLCLAARRPLILSPQTIGPFQRPWIRKLALDTMRRARAVAVRDGLSAGFAREMGYDGALIEASDVALRLPYERPAAREGGPVKVGLNVSGLLWNGGYTGDNMFGLKGDYRALVRRIARKLTDAAAGQGDQDGKVELHLVGHVLSAEQPVEDDQRAAEALATEVPGAVVAPVFATPSEAKSYIAGMDFFAGARMHACIAAFSAGVAVVPMAYSRKFAGLFGTLGYDHVADLTALGTDEAADRVLDGFARRETLAREAEAALNRGLARLETYEDALVEAFSSVAEASSKTPSGIGR